MNIKNYLSTLTLLLFALTAFGQKATTSGCGTKLSKKDNIKFRQSMSKFKKQQRTNKTSKRTGVRDYQIPVVFHILHNGQGEAGSVSKENMACRINDVMEVVNKDFRGEFPKWNDSDTRFDGVKQKMDNIEFLLATEDPDGNLLETPGMNWRVQDGLVEDGYDPKITTNNWWWGKNNKYYLQIFIVAAANGISEGNYASGHAFLPTQDAVPRVVFNWRYLGRATGCPDNPSSSTVGFEKVMSHEFGHYFGLRHTFHESDKDKGTWTAENDGIDDTPPTMGSEGCTRDKLNACNVYPNVENYMDYNTSCQIMFTKDQVDVMNGWLEDTTIAKYSRSLLWQTDNLIATGILPHAPVASFKSDVTAICSTQSIEFKDNSTGNPTSWKWTFEGGTPATSSEKNPTVTYATKGQYKVTLEVWNGFNGTNYNKTETANFIDVDQHSIANTSEDFEGTFPPQGWRVINPDGKLAWGKSDEAGNGDSSCVVMNNADNDKIGEEDFLQLPFYNLTAAKNAQLYFDVAYVKFDEVSADMLKAEVSTDCGATWTEVYSKTHTELETVLSALSPNDWIPNQESHWRKELIDLSSYDGQANLAIRFKNVSGYGTRVWLDNVTVSLDNSTGPIVDFYTKKRNSVCESEVVQFFDTSTGTTATTWAWEFPGGTPANSTEQNPTVTYNTYGNYNVSLKVENTDGSSEKTIDSFIVLKTPTAQSFSEDFSGTFPPADWNIRNFDGKLQFEKSNLAGNGDGFCMMMNNADNETIGELDEIIMPSLDLSVGATDFYFDVAYTKFDDASPDKLMVMASSDCGTTWDNLYEKTHTVLETVNVVDDPATDANESNNWIPTTASDWRKERVNLSDYQGLANVLVKFVNTSGYGTRIWIDNVTVNFDSKEKPTSSFEKQGESTCLGNNVQFNDTSTGVPTSWDWTFEGGTPANSTEKNPVVTYDTAGNYSVTLTATNATGTGTTTTKTSFVTVKDVTALPYNQDFEGTFPIANWEIINHDNDEILWEKRTDAGNGDSSCMIINNADNPTDKIDELIINPLDFSSDGDKKMSFDLSYTKFTNAYGTDAESDSPDKLMVLVSKNCGLTWTEVYNKTHTELETVQVRDLEATPDDNEANDFIPSKASDWRKESIDLNDFTGNSSILIKFKNISGYGTRIWIDNLSVTSTITTDDITWAGTTDNDWNTASNWSTNTLPTSTSRIIIPSGLTNYPTANSAITFTSLTIESGATFMAKAAVTGTVTYKRNIENTDWYLISSPLKEETLENFITGGTLSFASGTRGNIGFAPFNNEHLTKAWNYQTINSTGNFDLAKGYSLKLATPSDISFTGEINTSDVNIEINNGTRNNYNLVGNPFTTYINAVTFLNNNETSISEKTIWIWNGTTYEVYNEQNSLEIAPAQGFFIETTDALPANSSVTFTKANQSHQNTDTFKREAPKTSFELFVEDGTRQKSTKVFYANNKTTGFDNGSDSKLFGGVSSNFEVFTELISDNKGNKLAIQTLPASKIEELVIPVGLTTKMGKEVSISVDAKNLPEDVKIYLEDRIANTFTNISDKKIVVKNNTKGAGQFYIHTTSKKPDVIVNKEAQNVSIYKSDKNTITITGLQTQNASLKVYSILGKTIFNNSFKSTGVSLIELPKTSKGVYIVELISNTGKITKKIILE
ncbi:PKD domain-containing protein [Tenacibaculum finnmarkense]|uniref:PKD domain-containing protein n=1 Tax=Tenacibaculum finnmarkense TaxID=2781243 RepID=UPI000C42684C|nr:PKD domain-containing protein [Tenacibaculum finnmarkense]MCD8439645.1 PKD domain-containing protein [Tenacibaculum finnmarkense genomovar ulcerans]SOS56120.1 Protein of unknown function precursor containing PKD domains and a C-terminal secretion signal. Putative peptidase M43 family [Tenacibaculum finnmarkense]